ncbi:hypothetical protein MTR67_032191 [Solanum verrucosum]|uniref:Uncharacterized protein n=1 Tax=Solanum verrucosum TaxID=315347 RepID=A0AAF0ZF64_SOLVR|nr:hypothetical protein MTR67_032191 [Solanum verrucosum]
MMNLSDMTLQIINGVKWYFNRNWNRIDMMNFDEIPEQVHTTLMKVYLSLFCAYFWILHGMDLSSRGEIHSPFNTRFLLLMLAAYSFGASLISSLLFPVSYSDNLDIPCLFSSIVLRFLTDTHCADIVLMIYSQEILYDADFGDINLVNCTLAVFFHLPGIVIHAARLYLQGAGIEQHEHN